LDPTVINGGVINSLRNTAHLGKGEWAVIESDESDGSFLKLPITYSIVTNVDKEHLDFYKTYENLKKYFLYFVNNILFDGVVVYCKDNIDLKRLISKSKKKNKISYGFKKGSDVRATNILINEKGSFFDINIKKTNLLKKETIKNTSILKKNDMK